MTLYVPHSWILETMKLSVMVNNAVRLMEKSIRTWSTEMEYSENHLTDVCIKREIFQGGSLLLLLVPYSSVSDSKKDSTGFQVPRGTES